MLRALAIVSIVGTHANLFTLLGGAHLLLAVVGFNVARFQLTSAGRDERARHLLRSALRVAVPSVLVIAHRRRCGPRAWAGGRRSCSTASRRREWSEPGWYYWFVEAVVYAPAVVAALAAGAGRSTGSSGRHPFWLPFGLAVAALRDPLRHCVGVPGDNVHRVARASSGSSRSAGPRRRPPRLRHRAAAVAC